MLYGLADVAVLAVGGLLLLPLYTRALTQTEFGVFVAVRTNTEILTYVLYLGLPSAVARVYFDYRERGEHREYLGSVLIFFAANLALCAVIFSIWGDKLWHLLSPTTPPYPYVWFSFALAAVGFFGSIGALLLRLELRVRTFAGLQVGTSLLLAATAIIFLVVLKWGVPGLLTALLISSACNAAVLPWMLRRSFKLSISSRHIVDSMRYAGPILVGYIAYFVLNRTSTLVLQHNVDLSEVAVFGVAQQLASIVAIAGTSFGKAAQPAVFAASAADAGALMTRAARILMLLMLGVTCLVLTFASELFAIAAPKGYAGGFQPLLILTVAGLAYSFSFVSDTALLYHRRPKLSVAVSLSGAAMSTLLALVLVPRWGVHGAALGVAGGFLTTAAVGQALAHRVTGQSYLAAMVGILATATSVALLAAWLDRLQLPLAASLGVKSALVATVAAALLAYRSAAAKKARGAP